MKKQVGLSVSERRVLFEKCDENINHIYQDLWFEFMPNLDICLLKGVKEVEDGSEGSVNPEKFYYVYQESDILTKKFIRANKSFDLLNGVYIFFWRLFHLKFSAPKLKLFRVMIVTEETMNSATNNEKRIKNNEIDSNYSTVKINNVSLSTTGNYIRNIELSTEGKTTRNLISGLFISSDNINASNIKKHIISKFKSCFKNYGNSGIADEERKKYDTKYKYSSIISINGNFCLKIDSGNFNINDDYYRKIYNTSELVKNRSFINPHDKVMLRELIGALSCDKRKETNKNKKINDAYISWMRRKSGGDKSV